MVNSALRRNVVFVAGWALAGLAIALLVNHFWQRPAAANPSTAATSADSGAQSKPAVQAAGLPESVAPTNPAPPGPGAVTNSLDAPQTQIASYATAVRASAPAVVSVYTQTKVNIQQRTPDGRWVEGFREGIKPGLGSGVIMDAQGHIITNDHVINTTNEKNVVQHVDEIHVQLADGTVARATVVGTDPATDLAVLKIDPTSLIDPKGLPVKSLPVMPIGRADRLAVGDIVLAIGSPLGLSQTVTQGIVSAVGRVDMGLSVYENFIQTDAAINHGNSGGALINTRGELIGINTASIKYQGSEGLGMAIPVELVRGVMQEILKNKRVIRGWLGWALADVSEQYAQQVKLPHHGVLIAGMHEASPALLAGLAVGDKLETVNGQPVRTGQELGEKIAATKPGSSVKLSGTRARNLQAFSVAVTVIEAPEGSQ